MTGPQLAKILESGAVAAVPAKDWRKLGRDFEETEAHDTGIGGMLRLGRLDGRLVAVEQPEPDRLAVRPFRTRKDASAFVKDRLEAYDRLWDG
jgi:hypothetical protein